MVKVVDEVKWGVSDIILGRENNPLIDNNIRELINHTPLYMAIHPDNIVIASYFYLSISATEWN